MNSSSTPWMIEASGLSKTYQTGRIQVNALKEASFNVSTGEFVVLMGPSGSGKSTLLHLLGCLDTPTAGVYRLAGRDVSRLSKDERTRIRNRQIGFVFQSFNLLPRASAWENVALPLLYRSERKSLQANVKDLALLQLEKVGLKSRADHNPAELSGGESQRVAIARALITDPDLLLADEPTGNLDRATGAEILAILAEMNREGRTLLVVTHDLHVASYASRVLVLSDGKIVREEQNDAHA
jgi:putative ABC transport system ATP-binding protein